MLEVVDEVLQPVDDALALGLDRPALRLGVAPEEVGRGAGVDDGPGGEAGALADGPVGCGGVGQLGHQLRPAQVALPERAEVRVSLPCRVAEALVARRRLGDRFGVRGRGRRGSRAQARDVCGVARERLAGLGPVAHEAGGQRRQAGREPGAVDGSEQARLGRDSLGGFLCDVVDPRLLVDLASSLPPGAVHRLGTNHRSTAPIVAAAASILQAPSAPVGGRRDHTRWPLPELTGHADEVAEASAVAHRLLEARWRGGRAWSSMAVLTRTRAQLDVIAPALAARDIPHRLPGSLLDRPEVVEVMRALRGL
ncbi:MAG: hypothetical protein KY439_12545, partial [Actinobacteria bacterium]|nr:hypothetical protein [Actinomycetota bacterium]